MGWLSEALGVSRSGFHAWLSRRPDPSATPSASDEAGRRLMKSVEPAATPDGRYIVVRGRLWRRANPDLPEEVRTCLIAELMAARRDKGAAIRAKDAAGREAARKRVNAAKVALGERGPVWWMDGAPDLNRRMARTTVYGEWFADRTQSPPVTQALIPKV